MAHGRKSSQFAYHSCYLAIQQLCTTGYALRTVSHAPFVYRRYGYSGQKILTPGNLLHNLPY
jgi:hypothetical protein